MIILAIIGLTSYLQVNATDHLKKTNTTQPMDILVLMKKRILIESSPVLFNQPVSPENLAQLWTIHHSEWKVEDGWLIGENKGNWPGMAILKQDFPGNVLVELKLKLFCPLHTTSM
jgi:hypothetical protein